MLRRVLSRAPLPTSIAAVPVSKLSPTSTKRLKAGGLTAHFVTPAEVSQATDGTVPLGFKAEAGEVAVRPDSSREVVAGLGSSSHVRDYRLAVTNVVRRAQRSGASSLCIHPPTGDVMTVSDLFHPPRPLRRKEVVEKTACFAVAGAYRYDRLKTPHSLERPSAMAGPSCPPPKKKGRGRQRKAAESNELSSSSTSSPASRLQEVVIASSNTHAIRTGAVIGACVNDARNLGNLREDEGVPAFYAEWARKCVVPCGGVKIRKVLRGEQIRNAGLNLLYSVGKGSIHEPYVVVLEYVGNRRSAHSTALIGKGVTFDCGGLNVKPYGSMETMHTDMMGAGTVLATMKAAATLQLPVNLVAVVGLVENAIGPDSLFPSSILTSLKGTTVEILNTDAEGRLVLADLLTYVQRDVKLEKPVDTIIDLATLTGAIITSLGPRRAGLFANNPTVMTSLFTSGVLSGEEVWPMPIGEEHVEQMKGGVADLINCARGRHGGSCNAAAFLSHFVERGVSWVHLDIAGPADVGDKPKGFEPAGVSGFGVQLLMDYLRLPHP